MPEQIYPDNPFKRHTAHKLKIGDILKGSAIIEGEKLRFVQINGNNISRVNLVANITEKYIQDEEKKFASITLDDASGQIKLKAFGDNIEKFKNFEQGETILAIGLLRQWSNEIYITPEIIRKKNPSYLLLRKLEIEKEKPEPVDKNKILELKDKIIQIIKREEENNGADIESITKELNSKKEIINDEIRRLLEEGIIYEPRPGKVRYLG